MWIVAAVFFLTSTLDSTGEKKLNDYSWCVVMKLEQFKILCKKVSRLKTEKIVKSGLLKNQEVSHTGQLEK